MSTDTAHSLLTRYEALFELSSDVLGPLADAVT